MLKSKHEKRLHILFKYTTILKFGVSKIIIFKEINTFIQHRNNKFIKNAKLY